MPRSLAAAGFRRTERMEVTSLALEVTSTRPGIFFMSSTRPVAIFSRTVRSSPRVLSLHRAFAAAKAILQDRDLYAGYG